MKDIKEKLVEALRKDFHELYVKEYTTDWQVKRLVRDIELGIMPLTNTLALLNKTSQIVTSKERYVK